MDFNVKETFKAYAGDWITMALQNIDREFPASYAIIADSQDHTEHTRPYDQHPAFYGSYDWHSSVEMHWVLVTCGRMIPGSLPMAAIRQALDVHLSVAAIEGEIAFFASPHHNTWERPYGWAWLLKLAHALAEWDDPDARRWLEALMPLIDLLVPRLISYFRSSRYPIRYGLHGNSAFSLELAWFWAIHHAPQLEKTMRETIPHWYQSDQHHTYGIEPSGTDFLSPRLSESAVMARYLNADDYPLWLDQFTTASQLKELATPIELPDSWDGQLGHLFGLQLSRAYHLFIIARHLKANHPYHRWLTAAADHLLTQALPTSRGLDYLLDHWLPAFALLALTARLEIFP